MRNKVLIFTVVASIIFIGLLGTPQVEAQPELDRHLVLFNGSAIPKGFTSDVEALGGSVVFTHKVGIAIVEGLTDDAAAQIGASNKVSAIQPNETFYLDPITDGGVEAVGDPVPESPTDPTTAHFFPRQWNMRTIEADTAWAAGRLGSPSVTLAILDTGIDYTYPDLNGLVDLSRSVSFVPLDDLYVDFYFPGKHHVTDLHYHGTHVASTAVSNGGVIAGVTSQTTLMGVKVCSAFGGCALDAIVQGILHAVDNGADVANMSLGGGFYKAGSKGFVGFINRLFNYANSAGMTVVVSAGNSAWDLDHFPNVYKTYCSAPNTICVSATGPTAADGVNGPWYNVDAPAYYTNYGRSAINVAAPGGNSGGSVWSACSQTSLEIPICQTGTYVVGLGGTSMAAPHVSGLAALVVEDVGRRPGQVRAKIQQSADDLGKKGTDPFYGKGRINVGTYATD
jgi:subtilisin family serine protease